jgi:hypothetical protein
MTQFTPPPHDGMDDRESALKQDGYLLGIALLSLVNGMHFSPLYDLFLVPVAALATGFWISSKLIIFYLASLIISVSVAVLAGVPAALYERYAGLRQSSVRSLQIWLAATFVLSLPALLALFRGG